ncbi:hypothetical protein Tco_1117170, partial [Tanacetum coccineum]
MVDVNVNVPAEQAPAMAPPSRTDEQILPHIRWVPIGKRNCYLDAERITRGYKCQLDEQWFDLTKDTLRDALLIMPVNKNKAFSSPPTPDTLIQFVNELGYPKEDVEEFTPSIYTFTEDKKNLAQQTQGKKKATLILIPSVRFTKLIIFHLQRKHNFHPRPESPLHLPTEEPVLGYLKFSAKGTKREVFGMPIPNDLITDDIRGAQYYDAFLEKVAKHQTYLAEEEVSDPDSLAPKPAKPTKPKATKQAKPVAPKAATKKPKPALAKPRDKKCKPVSQQLVDEFVDEGVPLTEPSFGDLEADTQRAIEESLKEAHGAHMGPLPLVVFRETDPRKLQPLPERRTSASTEPSVHEDSSSLYVELGLSDIDTESGEEVPPVVKSGAQDEGQAGLNHGKQDEGQATPNPGNDTVSQPQSTPVHVEPNLEHTNENLKLTADEPVIPEEPTSSTGTLSSLQHLAKDFSFGDQFFNDKPSEVDNKKTTADTEAESMVSITIHQDTSAIPPMTSPVIDIVSRPDSPNVYRPLPTTTTATTKMTI